MKTLTCLAELLQSDEIYILFGGPSLKDFDLSKLDGKPTLGCNKSAEVYPCSAVISIDPVYINTRTDFLKNYPGYVALAHRETSQGATKPNQAVLNHVSPDYTYFHDKRHPDKMSDDPGVLYGTNTGHAAINFAVLQGFKTIHALGLDMNKQGHWHGGYTHGRQYAAWLEGWAAYIDGCKDYLDSKGVRMINYNRDSAVRAYEFSDIW